MFQLMGADMHQIRRVFSYLGLTLEVTKLSILSAMEYRVSFLTQVVGMIINDLGLVLVWLIFFQKFTSVNGWGFPEMALLFAISTVNHSLLMIFARGAHHLGRFIARGELDYFLSYPKNVLWHACVSKTDISSIGDLIFGLGIFFLFGQPTFEKFIAFLGISIVTALIIFNFNVITQSLTFYFGNFEEAAEQMHHALLGLALYPQTSFYGGLKIVTLTVLPAFFIAAVPVQILQGFNLSLWLTLLVFWLTTSLLAVFVFQKGLRRYESGSLINVHL
jgi:ABC-2 type transport system permease protein